MASLISAADQQKLREAFAEMTRTVHLVFFTQTLDCETCLQTRQILDELPLLSDKIVIDELNLVLDKERAQQFGIARVPAVAITFEDEARQTHDTRVRFLGAPSGYEFISLVQAVLIAGGRAMNLKPATVARLAAVDKPVTMQVFTTPT
jgi:alkyl hydroperoxide reductase subunit AhpF